MDKRILDAVRKGVTPWELASVIGCHYCGDMDPVMHGGWFYDSRDWVEHGYASVVEFWELYDSPADMIVVNTGVINHPGTDMQDAYRACDIPWTEDNRNSILCQIEATRGYTGVEPDNEYCESFNLDEVTEDHVWEQVLPLIVSLGN